MSLRSIGDRLVAWYEAGHRDLPWRDRPEPYRVLVSEMMLQQTTVKAAIPYFRRFIERFPDIHALAASTEDEVIRIWSGLGYYGRARRLREIAKAVVLHHGGELPSGESELLALPGIGPYTAGAIRAIAFNLTAAAVDGNTARVVARLFGLAGDPATSAFRRRLESLVVSMSPPAKAASFTQALMELGALVCLPRSPDCLLCPLRTSCAALEGGLVNRIPPPRKRPKTIALRAAYGLVERRGRILLLRRAESESRMPGLLELPGLWLEEQRDDAPAALASHLAATLGQRFHVGDELASVPHVITRHRIRCTLHAASPRGRIRACAGAVWAGRDEAVKLATSGVTRKLLLALEKVQTS